jgi:hypothetical protein
MAGKIKILIDTIIEMRAKDDPILQSLTRTKLMLKGINVRQYTLESEDDQAVIGKLEVLLKEL